MYPYETLSHNPEHHDEIHNEYEKVYQNINHAVNNPQMAMFLLNGAMEPISQQNPMFSDDAQNQTNTLLQNIVKSLPQTTSGLYGDHQPSVYGKATFLDRINALRDPTSVMEHMNNGTATANQITTVREAYPSLWQELQTTTLNDLVKSDEQGPEYRLAVYGYTGIETHPNVSSAALMQKLQTSMAAAQQTGGQSGQQTASPSNSTGAKTPQMKPPKEPMSSLVSEPFTSPLGRMP